MVQCPVLYVPFIRDPSNCIEPNAMMELGKVFKIINLFRFIFFFFFFMTKFVRNLRRTIIICWIVPWNKYYKYPYRNSEIVCHTKWLVENGWKRYQKFKFPNSMNAGWISSVSDERHWTYVCCEFDCHMSASNWIWHINYINGGDLTFLCRIFFDK